MNKNIIASSKIRFSPTYLLNFFSKLTKLLNKFCVYDILKFYYKFKEVDKLQSM